jgi:hypothetical protein
MKVALIGLPQSGKSTLFMAVTGQKHETHGALQPVHAVVRVPDSRLAYLTELSRPKKVTEATIEFIDFPGCSLDDAKGKETWRRLLPDLRQAELLVVVVRDFQNASVPTFRGRIDAPADFAFLWEELIFADLDTVTTRIERLEKSLKKPSKTHDADKRELGVLTKCREALENAKPLASVLTSEEEQRQVANFTFVTEKPIVCVRNVADDQAASAEPLVVEHVVDSTALCASIEAEIALLDPADRPAFLADLGLIEPARDRLIHLCYQACGLISFLTMGPEEVRAWTVAKGTTAVEAAARIHTDLARGFVRAETVSYEDLVAHKDMKGARAAGKVRKEGKSYVVADGDVILILSTV